MAIPVPTIDEITGKTVMQKIRSLISNYLQFAQEVVDEVDTIDGGQLVGIVTAINEDNIIIRYTFKDGSTKTSTLPVASKTGDVYTTGLLALSQYNEIKASINDAEYSSTDSLFTITFTDNNNETETITVPIVGNRAGLLTSAMYTAITDGLSNLQISLAGKVDKVEGKGLSTNDFTDAEKTKLAGISGALQYKGSVVNYADLPTTDQNVGDVWNVENGYLTYPAGTNFAWNGTEWDALGGAIDLSDFVTNGQLTSALSEKQNELTAGTGISIVNDVISSTPMSIGLFTEQTAGAIKGSIDDYKVKSEIDGTGSINGLSELANDVMSNMAEIATKASIYKITAYSQIQEQLQVGDVFFAYLEGTASGYRAEIVGFVVEKTTTSVRYYSVGYFNNRLSSTGTFNVNGNTLKIERTDNYGGSSYIIDFYDFNWANCTFIYLR